LQGKEAGGHRGWGAASQRPFRFNRNLFWYMLSSMVLIPVAALLLAAQLPPKTQLDLWLVTPIEETTTPDNQEITLRLARDLKLEGQVFAPKDTTVNARVTLVRKAKAFIHNVPRTYYIVGLQLMTINIGDKPVPVEANLESVGPTNLQEDYFVPLSHGPDRWGALEQYRSVFKLPAPKPGESFLGVVREGLRVPKDLRFVFRISEAK
jgi:hypothetical protein